MSAPRYIAQLPPLATTEGEQGFVEVRKEPRHHHRFENDFVRVYDVRFPAGEASLYHRHAIDTFYVTVYDTQVADTALGKDQASMMELPCGLSGCRPHGDEPLIHKVENAGQGLMHMIGAEVKASPAKVAKAPLKAPYYEKLQNPFASDRLRLYRITLQPGESTGLVSYDFSGLTVMLSDATVQVRSAGQARVMGVSPGDFSWHDGPATQSLTNVGDTLFDAILGEWL